MKKLASGGLTLRQVNTIYDIKLAPFVVSIPTDAGGGNPVLTGAKSKLVVTYLNEVVAATITSLVTTNCNATHALGVVSITAISADTGQVQVNFTVDGNPLSAVLTWAIAKQGGQGEAGYTVVLTNEAHTLPATYAGIVTAEEIAKASSSIRVFKGAVELTPVAANAMPGIGQFRYNLGTVTGGTANRIDNSSFTLVSITADTALINVNVHCEGSMVIAKMMTVAKSKAGAPGDNGEPGLQGPFVVDRGLYNNASSYHGATDYIEVVSYGNPAKPYYTHTNAGNFSGVLPTNTGKWNEFAVNFESLYVQVLKAVTANIINLEVGKLRTANTGARIEIYGSTTKAYHANNALAREQVIENGVVKDIWYDMNGVKTRDLSYLGETIYVEIIPETWYAKPLVLLSNNMAATATDLKNILESHSFSSACYMESGGKTYIGINSNLIAYAYVAGRNPNSDANKIYEGYKIADFNKIDNVADGWYTAAHYYFGEEINNGFYPVFIEKVIGGKVTQMVEVSAQLLTDGVCTFPGAPN